MNRICLVCSQPFVPNFSKNVCDNCVAHGATAFEPNDMLSQDDVNKLEGFAPVTASPAFAARKPLAPSLTQVGERYTELVEAFTELHVALIEENQRLKGKVVVMEKAGNDMEKWIDVEADSCSDNPIILTKQWNHAKSL